MCWTLHLLNQVHELNGNITFKGGTSLSKAWGMIDRFSEDLDIAVNRRLFGQEPPLGAEDAGSNTQRKLRLEELQEKSQAFVQQIILPGLLALMERILNPDDFKLSVVKKGNEVNIEFEYPGSLKEGLGGLLPVVLIELVPRADDIPNEQRPVTPILNEVFPELLGKGTLFRHIRGRETFTSDFHPPAPPAADALKSRRASRSRSCRDRSRWS